MEKAKPILSMTDIDFLVSDRYISDYFDAVRTHNVDPKTTFNLIKNEVMKYLKDKKLEMKEFKLDPKYFAELVLLITSNKTNTKTKDILFKEIVEKNISPFDVMKEKNLYLLEDEKKMRELIAQVLKENEASVNDYKNGKDRALKYLMGVLMKETKGMVNTEKLNTILLKELSN